MATAVKKEVKEAAKLLASYTKLYAEKEQANAAHKAKVAPLDEKMEKLKGELETWAKNNKELFGTKKTMELEAGTFGHKLGTKAVAFPLEAKDEKSGIKDKYCAAVQRLMPTAIVLGVDSKRE